jgi:hypothetical protein
MSALDCFAHRLTEEACYEWGNLFAAPPAERTGGMASKAAAAGCTQEAGAGWLTWQRAGDVVAKIWFIDDPTAFAEVRRVFNDGDTPHVPESFVVVRQPDARDTRGTVVFDIFRLSPGSYLTHENRVYTPPKVGAA